MLLGLVAPIMASFRTEIGWPSDVAIFGRDAMLVVETSRQAGQMLVNRHPGYRAPILATSLGLAYLANRIVISSMCQYSARDGLANAWHFAHLAKFAVGGAGIVFVEATAVEARGRITHGDMGLWSDRHADALRGIVEFTKDQGAVAAIQLAHAGRRASIQRPWHGNGPLDETDAARGETPWNIVSVSDEPTGPGHLVPHALGIEEIGAIRDRFVDAARRANALGFDIAEIHAAHGFLLHSFLSPLSNSRVDAYGGDLNGRMRFALEVVEAVREVWPVDKPLFFRVSAVDGDANGWQVEDSIALARELKLRGVDVVDCSSGGIAGSAPTKDVSRRPGFLVPFASRIRNEANIMTQAVGLITRPEQAENVLQEGSADFVAIAREALYNPHWPLHAVQHFGIDKDYHNWPDQYGWWLARRKFHQ